MEIELIARAQALDGESPSFYYSNFKLVEEYDKRVAIANVLAKAIFEGKEEALVKNLHEIYSHEGRLIIKIFTNQTDEAGRVDGVTFGLNINYSQTIDFYTTLFSSIDNFLQISGRKNLTDDAKESLKESLINIKKKGSAIRFTKKLIHSLITSILSLLRLMKTRTKS